ncbi:D-alanyl-D-alanine carboxypeptidase [Niameybacter massiliensis]|uniref:serine-type D-Ala-D-Ala carboxypeptidase n=1 Tax=Holtiella tumoricola TaxID=3018743 RepID=A0AA42DPU7_9FIRM|nr:D-alanyl-D-alanine carboxypeptidase family protein [Holtiella tumoricola]MDA3732493.1 D-alanyl-D-alanine carboxypeptidase [Holtiella tumoricola]
MKKRLKSIVALTLLMTQCVYASEGPGTIYSKGSVLIEKDSKRILYEQNAHEPLPMASTTKIMTCIVAIESGKLDEIVTVSSRAARAPKVKLNLQTGEKQKLGDLLYSLMLESHNDTAIAVAEHVGGSVEGFCEMMTEKAKELGAEDTCFETPNGLDGPNHHATAYDMALIAAYALENPKFVEIITTPEKSIPTETVEGSKPHQLRNKNRFLSQYQGAEGVKTGFTNKAGHCFVGAVKKDGMELIGVSLGAGWNDKGKSRKYTDVIKLMNYGFDNYKKYQVIEDGENYGVVPVIEGKEEQIEVHPKEDIILPLSAEEKASVEIKKTLPNEIEAPIVENQVIGKLEVVCGNTIIEKTELLANRSIAKATLMDKIKKFFNIEDK